MTPDRLLEIAKVLAQARIAFLPDELRAHAEELARREAIRKLSEYEATEGLYDNIPVSVAITPSEDTCEKCGNRNVVWFTSNEIWNRAVQDRHSILCPVCFVILAEESGVNLGAWYLSPEEELATLRARLASLIDLVEEVPLEHLRWCDGDTEDCDCPGVRKWLDKKKEILQAPMVATTDSHVIPSGVENRDSLRARLAETDQDRDRLDWLIAHGCYVRNASRRYKDRAEIDRDMVAMKEAAPKAED